MLKTRRKRNQPKGLVGNIVELVITVAIAIGLALLIQAFLVKPYRIPSPSMVPTLQIGQRILVSRLSTSPGIGDVVVFHPPAGADPVEPDLIFFRKGNEPRSGDKLFAGVPNLVIEVLSPKSRRVDQGTKLEIYQEAGIREYWLVDPLARTVVIYRLGEKGAYEEWARASEGKTVSSAELPGLRLVVSKIFPPR